MSTIWTAILSAVGTGIFALIVYMVKMVASFLKRSRDEMTEVKTLVEKVHTNDIRRSRQMGALFKATSCTTQATRAILEVVAGIKNNGNVSEAMECMDEGDKITKDFHSQEAWS